MKRDKNSVEIRASPTFTQSRPVGFPVAPGTFSKFLCGHPRILWQSCFTQNRASDAFIRYFVNLLTPTNVSEFLAGEGVISE